MSLRVKNLSKHYSHQKAVNNITFEIGEGEIVGFLGPNGAGKSTTMKMVTGYVPPTSGEIFVGEHDVTTEPMPVKRITGYLPEHNPLYLDLYVHEYLTFIGKMYGLSGTHLRARVGEMIERCGLTPEQNKKLEALSKGYRQRVGLAQALIHDPKVLILDEPTSGLDPNQLAEIRKLIKDISLHKTVLFSTHIMQEVQALCDRVIIINKGEIVADSMLNALLHQRGEHQFLIAEFAQDVNLSTLATIEGVIDVSLVSHGIYKLAVKPDADVRASLFRMAADQNLSLIGLRQEENSLEAIFQQLTQGVTAGQ